MMERLPQERLGAAVSKHRAMPPESFDETLDYITETEAFRSAGRIVQLASSSLELVTNRVSQTLTDQCVLAFNEGRSPQWMQPKVKWWSAEIQNDVIDACDTQRCTEVRLHE